MVVVGVEVALLPCQMFSQHGPHLAHVCRVGVVAEVPQQFVNIVQVHVVMVHLVVALRVSADVTVAIHLCAPFLFGAGQVHLGVVVGVRQSGGHVGHLTLGIGIEVGTGAVVPSQYVA